MNKRFTITSKMGYLLLTLLLGLSLTVNTQAQDCLSGGSSVETNTITIGNQCIYTLDVTFIASADLMSINFGVSDGTITVNAFTLMTGTNTVTVTVTVNCFAPLPDIILSGVDNNFMNCGTLTIPFDGALPVELSLFQASVKDGTTRLEWSTASEYNTEQFIVERSPNGQDNFLVIGSQSAVGFSEVQQSYQLTDPFTPALAYYRLRIVDFDGSYEFSNIVVVTQKNWEIKQLRVGPNPIGKEQLRISFEKNGEAPANILLLNSQGQIVWEKNNITTPGFLYLDTDLSEFPNGVYHLAIQQGKQIIASETVVKSDTY